MLNNITIREDFFYISFNDHRGFFFIFQSSLRSDIGLASPNSVTTSAKSAAPFYSFTAANPRRRSLQDPPAIGQCHLNDCPDTKCPKKFFKSFLCSFLSGRSLDFKVQTYKA